MQCAASVALGQFWAVWTAGASGGGAVQLELPTVLVLEAGDVMVLPLASPTRRCQHPPAPPQMRADGPAGARGSDGRDCHQRGEQLNGRVVVGQGIVWQRSMGRSCRSGSLYFSLLTTLTTLNPHILPNKGARGGQSAQRLCLPAPAPAHRRRSQALLCLRQRAPQVSTVVNEG